MFPKRIFYITLSIFIITVPPTFANQGEQIKRALKQTFELATAAYQSKKYNEAIMLYEKTLQIFPDFAPTHYYLGMAHKGAQSSSDKVIYHFKRAVEIQPNHEAAHEELGKIYYAIAEFNLSETHSLKVLEINPNNFLADLTLGWTYLMGKSQPDDAISHFEACLEKRVIPYAYLGLGMSYFMLEDRARVLEMITFLRQTDKENLAQQLEAMIRDPSLMPKSIPGEPLFRSPSRSKSQLVREPPPKKYPTVTGNTNFEEMPVRLSAPLGGSPSNKPQATYTGAERIQQLQQRSRENTSKGSGY